DFAASVTDACFLLDPECRGPLLLAGGLDDGERLAVAAERDLQVSDARARIGLNSRALAKQVPQACEDRPGKGRVDGFFGKEPNRRIATAEREAKCLGKRFDCRVAFSRESVDRGNEAVRNQHSRRITTFATHEQLAGLCIESQGLLKIKQ